ncbi:unnamed protein product [Rotaria sp. Silwood2]|nr:unnamed protein product [Rotaria sp. Silwood2]CAF4442923.1 unnamed protein product [Rotaria sp. Silwood2]
MLSTYLIIASFCCLLVLCFGQQQPSTCQDQGDGNYGCFDISTQGSCVEVTNEPATSDQRWPLGGIDLNLDWAIKCGKIVAYKIQWFNGGWSDWFVPGINDMDQKVNPKNGLRRWWGYFYDHTHTYIICKTNNNNKLNGCQ